MNKCRTNIQYVVDKKKCSGCGACYVACTYNAIEIKRNKSQGLYLPHIDKEHCVNCKACLAVCSGHTFAKKIDFDCANSDSDLGQYREIFYGYSADTDLRKSAASGGCISEILRSALIHNEIDGAIVVDLSFNCSIDSTVYIARTEADILRAKGSKYFPSNNCIAVKDVLKYTDERFAFVGLPCQVNAIRLLQEKYPVLKNNIKLVIGIFCGHMVNFHGTEALLSANFLNSSRITSLSYRGLGWPGFFNAVENSGRTINIRSGKVWQEFFQNNLYTPQRCLMCSDFFSNQADISVGDAWDPDLLQESSEGYSSLIVRSSFVFMYINRLMRQGVVHLKLYNISRMKKNFRTNILFSKYLIQYKMFIAKLIGLELPPADKVFKNHEQIKSIRVFVLVFLIFCFHKIRVFFCFVTKFSGGRYIYNKVYQKILWLLNKWSRRE